MSDIVERLRDGVERKASGRSALWDSIMAEAANEIERLTARLESLETSCQDCTTFLEADARISTLLVENRAKDDEIIRLQAALWSYLRPGEAFPEPSRNQALDVVRKSAQSRPKSLKKDEKSTEKRT